MIECQICHAVFEEMIHWKHLREHGLSSGEYREVYGPTTSHEYRERLSQSVKCGCSSLESWVRHSEAQKVAKARDREKIGAKAKEVWQRPGFRELHSTMTTLAVNEPDARAKKSASLRAAWGASSDDRKARAHTSMKERMADPEYLIKIKTGQDAAKVAGAFKTGKMSKPHEMFKAALEAAGCTSFRSERWVTFGMRCDEVDNDHGVVVEINGCWWHCCPRCFPDSKPQQYANVAEAMTAHAEKRAFVEDVLGWAWVEVWEHEIADPGVLATIVDKVIKLVKK